MFIPLGISIILAAILAVNSLSTLGLAGLWRAGGRLTQDWSATSRGRRKPRNRKPGVFLSEFPIVVIVRRILTRPAVVVNNRSQFLIPGDSRYYF